VQEKKEKWESSSSGNQETTKEGQLGGGDKRNRGEDGRKKKKRGGEFSERRRKIISKYPNKNGRSYIYIIVIEENRGGKRELKASGPRIRIASYEKNKKLPSVLEQKKGPGWKGENEGEGKRRGGRRSRNFGGEKGK